MDKNEKKNKKILKQMSNEKNKLIKKEEKESSKIPFKEKVKQATHTAKDFFIKIHQNDTINSNCYCIIPCYKSMGKLN